jgi:UDP-N-acetylmuramyl pentapeptide synthase
MRWESTQSLLEFLKDHPIKDKMILLKGSRGIALEKLMSAL